MFLKLAYLNLFRNKRRTISTGLAICIGFVGLNLLGAYIYRIKKALDNTSVYSALNGHIKIYKKDSLVQFTIKPKTFIFNKEEVEALENILMQPKYKVDYIGHNLNGSGLLSNGIKSHPVLFYSIEPEIYARSLMQPSLMEWARDWILPSQLENIDKFRRNEEVLSVTPKIAQILNLKMPLSANDGLQMAARSFDGDLNAINLDVGAEHTTGTEYLEDSLVLIPLKKAQELLGTEGIESMSIYLKPEQDPASVMGLLEHDLNKLSFKSDALFFYDEKINPVYLGTIGFLSVMGGFIVFLIGTAVSLTIINSLTMGIIERTKEIGTLLAVGFKNSDVKKMFVVESLLLCFMAVFVGIVLTFIFSTIINQMNIRFAPPGVAGTIQFKLVWNYVIAITVSAFVFLLTWASSVLVMNRKSKIKLIDLLNDTGA